MNIWEAPQESAGEMGLFLLSSVYPIPNFCLPRRTEFSFTLEEKWIMSPCAFKLSMNTFL